MEQSKLSHRLATHRDLADLESLIDGAIISENQKRFFSSDQMSSSRAGWTAN